MWIISPRAIKQFQAKYVSAASPLDGWLRVAQRARWRSLADVRRDYPHADAVTVHSRRVVTVFNVGGNKFRLIAAIHYNTQVIFVLRLLTHEQYDAEGWKRQL
jgi:mRNA interferase HigB